MGERATYRRFDWFIPACVAILVTYGVLFVGSARGVASDRAMKQLLWIGFGTGAFLAAVYVDYMTLLRHAYALYAAGMLALVLVLFTRPINSARSWFDLGFFKGQPSEFVKLIWVIAIARLLASHENYKRLSGLWPPLVLTFLPLALVLKQPDLGTGMLFIPALFAMLYAAGARARHLALMGGSGVAGAGVLWAVFMHGYQKRRILAWLNPEEYSATEAYHMLSARTAIGSGGLFGKGLGRGTLTQLSYVPENDTDLIYSCVAEEWGFVGCTALVIVFALLTVSCFAIARRVREPQGRLVAIGLTAVIAFQTVVNLWVAVGLLPTTGVPLPFVSYGGSSMISCFAAVGLIVNVGMRRHATLARDPFA